MTNSLQKKCSKASWKILTVLTLPGVTLIDLQLNCARTALGY